MGEASDIFFDTDSTDVDYSFILNTNDLKKHLTIFATNLVLINNQITTLLANESDANFDNFPYEELTTSQNEEDFKLAIANSGIMRYEELSDLILSQNQNAYKFLTENKDFSILQEETKQFLINEAIDEAVTEHPINWPQVDPGSTTQSRTCAQQFAIDKARCNRQNNMNGSLALLTCYTTIATGPGFLLGCGGATLIVLWQNKECQANAREDYDDCINN